MANARQTKEVLDLAHERKVFLAEAIWTRYQPAVQMVRDLINSGRIQIAPIITHTFSLDQLPEAIDMQVSAESIKVIVKA